VSAFAYPARLKHRLSPAEEKLLGQFLERLHAAAPAGSVAAVRVFGSRARGDSHERSDLDVAVMLMPGVDHAAMQRVVTEAQVAATEARDAWELALSALAIPDGPDVGIRDAIARDGFDIWRAPW
jgi:predicted nucleotidyltransferase